MTKTIEFLKIRFVPGGKTKPVTWWAIETGRSDKVVTYQKVTKEGDLTTLLPGNKGNRKEILLIGVHDELIWKKKARMNNKYGELEVVE